MAGDVAAARKKCACDVLLFFNQAYVGIYQFATTFDVNVCTLYH
jgi:hypothetical protein